MTASRRMVLSPILLALLAVLTLAAQIPEYDFYSDYRPWVQGLPSEQRTGPDAVADLYRKKLTSEGVAAAEIERRITLIRTNRDALEADFWNRFFTVVKNPGFNTEPNEYLVSVVAKRKPGRALDVGMGEGRNALYLAKLGWDVTGFDPAEKAVALAQERAKTLGLKIKTAIALDRTFDFGREQWDLILFSWVNPRGSLPGAIDGLKPGGIVVVEAGRTFFPANSNNALVEMFKPLRILHYSDERATSDFFSRREMDVIRLLAEKPAAK